MLNCLNMLYYELKENISLLYFNLKNLKIIKIIKIND